jgi:hypothetical protein
MKRNILLLLGIFIILAFGLLGFSKPSINFGHPITSEKMRDTPETKEVIQAVERSYDTEAEAAYTFDITKFSDAFINDPRFPVSAGTLETVRELTNNPSLESAGYLDYKLAFYSWRINATIHAEKVKEKAKKENRALTEEERKSLIDNNGRIAPARSQSPTRSLPLHIFSVKINNDIATVVLDDGPWTLEMYLALVDKKWYVAGVKGLAFHP